jgi:hypothetical protein
MGRWGDREEIEKRNQQKLLWVGLDKTIIAGSPFPLSPPSPALLVSLSRRLKTVNPCHQAIIIP